MTRMPYRSHRQVTYDEQLQEYVFTGNNALVPAETIMYVIFHEPTRRIFRYDPKSRQLKQVRVEKCAWTTRYLLCQDVIFHQGTSEIDDVTLGRNEQTQRNELVTYGSRLQKMTKR